ncbi:MAG: four helix bundle protein [Verrucomicrobiales bacterium]|nr:four helix bundle protein [Verrucomicrobiales bacterium]
MFSHGKLKVYRKALASAASLARHSTIWDKRHAVVDHLCRASESIVMNIAEGARLWHAAHKQHLLDYAMGSALECAACLDIAVIKQLLLAEIAAAEKRSLCEVVRMLMGLRRSWESALLREEPAEYAKESDSEPKGWLFPHERLDAYQVGLDFMRWFHALPAGAVLSSRLYRQVDKAATSVVLNIAEGNGRYLEGDRRNFLDIAEASAVKAAAYLDLCERKAELDPEQRQLGVDLLRRIALMVRGLSQG